MIVDQIKNAEQYYSISDRLRKGFEYLLNTDFSNMEVGKYEIEGNQLYALVQNYQTRSMEEGRWEAHKNYIDIQYVFDGNEKMGYAVLDDMEEIQAYNPEKDIYFFKGNGDFVSVSKNMFAVFFPQDVHMPCMTKDTQQNVRKVVVKVKI